MKGALDMVPAWVSKGRCLCIMAFVALFTFHEPRQASADLIVYSGRIEVFKHAGDPPLFQIVNLGRLRVVFEVPPTPLAAKQDSNGARPAAFSDLNRFSIKSENADVLQQAVWLTGLQVCIKDQSGNIRVRADLENRRQGLPPGCKSLSRPRRTQA